METDRKDLPQPVYDDRDVAAMVHGEGMDLFHVVRSVEIAPEEYVPQGTDYVVHMGIAAVAVWLDAGRGLDLEFRPRDPFEPSLILRLPGKQAIELAEAMLNQSDPEKRTASTPCPPGAGSVRRPRPRSRPHPRSTRSTRTSRAGRG
jgi:hypothetical protein